jgi:hypothetical protein
VPPAPDSRFAGLPILPSIAPDGSVRSVVALRLTRPLGPTAGLRRITADEPLDLMARRLLGDEGLWWRILDANPVRYPFRSHVPTAVRASLVLENSAGVVAVTLTARYESARGNNLRVTVRDDAGNTAFDELVVYEFDGTANVELERYRYLNADIRGVVDQIERRSGCLTASLEADGVALAPVTTIRLAGGRDGVPLATGELAPGEVLELPGAGPATRATRARSF